MRKIHILAAGAFAALAAGAGFVAGYKTAQQRLAGQYDEMMEKEIDRTREYYERKAPQFPTPQDALRTLHGDEAVEEIERARQIAVDTPEGHVPTEVLERIVTGLRYDKIKPAQRVVAKATPEKIVEVEIRQRNIFTYGGPLIDPEEDPEFDEMVNAREYLTIYIVTKEEHLENANEWRQIALTYFAGDDVLLDEKEEVVENPVDLIGVDNLQFGRWSDQPNVVYVRNETHCIEFEIILSEGKYSVEVLGLDG